MIMSYQDFINIVPKETKEFVDVVLKLYKLYVIDNRSIKVDDGFYIDNEKAKIFSILLLSKYQFDVNDITRVFFESNKLKYIAERFVIKEQCKKSIINEEIFNKSSAIWCIFKCYENYSFLTPEAIILEYFEKNCNDVFYSIIKKLFNENIDMISVFQEYKKIVVNYTKNVNKQLEIDFYQDLSYELIDYLEKSARVYKFFQMKKMEFNDELIATTDDTVIASLLISISLMKNRVALFLNSVGITKEKLEKCFKISYSSNSEFVIPPSYVAILKQYFDKYLFEGKNKNVERKNLSIEKVIGNILDRNFTNSRVLETVLSKSNFSIDYFDNFEEKLKEFEKECLIVKKQQKYQEFYGETSCDVIEFVDFVSKVHIIIKKSFDDGICNKKYISNEKDISNFSFFISSYFFKNSFINYFKENGISYEKVMKFLNISIKENEIEKVQSDIDLIIRQYKNIIFGVTSDKKKVSIDTVMVGIGNTKFSESHCIQNLIKDINPNLRISDDLSILINNYNINKESQRKYKLKQKFFGNMQGSTIEFVEKASSVYQRLLSSSCTSQFSNNDMVEISIYLTSIMYYEGGNIDFLKSLVNDKIFSKLGICNSPNSILENYEKNIDIIYKYFGKYVFGIKNKDKNKTEITMKDIYLNIFNKTVNDSLALYKFLDDVEFKITEYDNFDENASKFIEKKFEAAVEASIFFECINYFENLSKVYNNLCSLFDSNKISDKIIILDASKLLTIFLEKNNSSSINSEFKNRLLLLEKRGMNLNSYLNYLNINEDDFYKYENSKINYRIIGEKFSDIYESTLDEIIIDIFKENDFGYKFSDYIISLNHDPSVIAIEMETGEEVIVPMTKDEQINYFNNLPTSKLEFNIPSISSFGRELSEHSFIIADEYLKIAEMETGENDVIYNIQEELDKLSSKNDIRLFFRRKLSGLQKLEQNKTILNNLNKFLQEKEQTLYEQIEHFGYLKKLIAIYIYRLNNYILELENMIKNGEETNFNQKSLENMDIEIIKQILNDKLVDFKKSLIMSTQQYKKINMLLGTHALTLSKVSTYRNTVIPNLYMELSIRDGIISEQESLDSLKKINDLLNNMITNNNQLLDQYDFKKKDLLNSKILEINDEICESVKQILIGEHLMESNNAGSKNLIKKQ